MQLKLLFKLPSLMKTYETEFWDAIEGARAELSGSYYYDPEYDVEYNIPPKNEISYAKEYQYCMISLDTYIRIEDTLNEFELIKYHMQHSQDFATENEEFSTDQILNFEYKNWIIRISIICEQLVFLVDHVYQLRLPKRDMLNSVFEHSKVKDDKSLYFSLLNLIDQLHSKILTNVKSPNLKKARNEILHQAYFKHDLISNLSSQLFLFKYGLTNDMIDEDVYLEQGLTSEKIKNEIIEFSSKFLADFKILYSLFGKEFTANFKILMSKPKK